jgi:hypothetical protein
MLQEEQVVEPQVGEQVILYLHQIFRVKVQLTQVVVAHNILAVHLVRVEQVGLVW